MSQTALALAVGTSQAAISKIEAGERVPTWSTITIMLVALRAELIYIPEEGPTP